MMKLVVIAALLVLFLPGDFRATSLVVLAHGVENSVAVSHYDCRGSLSKKILPIRRSLRITGPKGPPPPIRNVPTHYKSPPPSPPPPPSPSPPHYKSPPPSPSPPHYKSPPPSPPHYKSPPPSPPHYKSPPPSPDHEY